MKRFFLIATILLSLHTCLYAETHYVNINNASPLAPYTNWATAATEIQPAIDEASEGDTVLVTNGVYATGGTVYTGETATNRVLIAKDICVRSVNGPKYTFIQGEGEYTFAVSYNIRGVRMIEGSLSGFTITNGYTITTGANFFTDKSGGGINAEDAASISNCIITKCSGDQNGGGVFGGTYYNCLIIRNHCGSFAGGASCGTYYNCTITKNTCANYDKGISGYPYGITLYNSIVYFNQDDNYGTDVTFHNSCTYPLPAHGSGVISNTPQFINITANDFRLNSTSPCINSGSNAVAALPYDIRSYDRIIAGTVDMGCYEYPLNIITITNERFEVGAAVTSAGIGGSNNAFCVGYIWWSNHTANTSGTAIRTASSNYWSATVTGLVTGKNFVSVYSSNSFDNIASDVTVISRGEPVAQLPYVAITSTPVTLDFYTDSIAVAGTNNAAVTGGMTIINESYAYTNTFPAATGWTSSLIHIEYGANTIIVSGTNKYGETDADGVLITRLAPTIPVVDITNFPMLVEYNPNGSDCLVSGTNMYTDGDMYWTVDTAPGTTNYFTHSGTAWTAQITNLFLGDNTVYIHATNHYENSAFDSCIITVAPVTNYVSPFGAHIAPFHTWANAATQIQDAVDIVAEGGVVWVTNGVYSTGATRIFVSAVSNRVTISKDISVRSVNGPEYTYIHGSPSSSGTYGTDAIRCVLMRDGLLSGFTLENGYSSDTGDVYSEKGGGGAYMKGGRIEKCIISNNYAFARGGGVCSDGGKIYDSIIVKNLSGGGGGGVYLLDYHSKVRNCLIIHNVATNNGGGAFINPGSMESCTVVSNYARLQGGGVRLNSSSSMKNSICYFNTAGEFDNYQDNDGFSSIQFNCIMPFNSDAGNITNAPRFIDMVRDNYRIYYNSATRDSGSTDWWMDDAKDLDGNNRVINGIVDMGCYEFNHYAYIVITNAPAVVGYNEATAYISGTNSAVDGMLGWINNRHASVTNWIAPGFDFMTATLVGGTNVIHVFGTNTYHAYTEDSCIIYRKTAADIAPFIVITNAPAIIPHTHTTAEISGTNSNIAGQLGWINDRHPAVTNRFPPGFATTIDSLEEGDNTITVYGTNVINITTNDVIVIHRETAAEVAPSIVITNAPAIITYRHTTAEISGTNSNIAGQLGWINDKNTALTNWFMPGFSTTVDSLEEGNNTITVCGTNMYGHIATDSVSIHRNTLIESEPHIATNALIYPSKNAFLYAPSMTNITWYVDRITDLQDGTNVTITEITMHIAATTQEVCVVTNNIQNISHTIAWDLPQTLWGGETNYVLRFEVVDSDFLTNSTIFFDNPFTVVPEPCMYGLYILLLGLLWRR